MRKSLKVRQAEFEQCVSQRIDVKMSEYTPGSTAQLDTVADMLKYELEALVILTDADTPKKDRLQLISQLRAAAVAANVLVGKGLKEF